MGPVTCAIGGLYNMICRDPDLATGGLDPCENELHADGFYAEKHRDIEELDVTGIDRRVQVIYNGQDELLDFVNGIGTLRQKTFTVIVKIGYATGNHLYDSYPIIGDDEHLITKKIGQVKYWPECVRGCVQGYITQTSATNRLDADRTVLEMTVAVTIYG